MKISSYIVQKGSGFTQDLNKDLKQYQDRAMGTLEGNFMKETVQNYSKNISDKNILESINRMKERLESFKTQLNDDMSYGMEELSDPMIQSTLNNASASFGITETIIQEFLSKQS